MAALITGLNASAHVEGVTYRDVTYLVNGYDRGRKVFEKDGTTTVENLGLDPLIKTTDMTLGGTTAGSMSGQYSGSITLYNDKVDSLLESNPSPVETATISSKKLKFTWDSSGFDSQVTKVRCYATVAGGASEWDQMYYVGEADASANVLEVDLTDVQISAGTPLVSSNGAPQGNYKHICLHKERLVLANRQRALKASGSASSGSSVTLVATALQNYASGYFDDMIVVLREGTGTEETREIASYTPASGTITFAGVSTAPTAGTAFAIYEKAGPTEVIWSEPGQPEVFPSENAVSIDNGLMDEVTAIATFHDHVIVFGRETMARVSTESGAWAIVPMEVGCAAPKTVVMVNGILYWKARKGVWILRPDFSGDSLTDNLLEDFTSDVNPVYEFNSCMAYFGRKLFLSMPGAAQTKNNLFYVFDFLVRGWFKREYPFHVQSMAVTHDDNGSQILLVGCAAGDPGLKVRQLETGVSDLGNTLSSKNAGTATAGSTTTLTDSGKSWTTNEFAGARVKIKRPGTTIETTSVIQSNTGTVLTFTEIGFTPASGDTYVIGGFDSVLETADFDFGKAAQGKRFTDAWLNVRDEFDSGSKLEVQFKKNEEDAAYRRTSVAKDGVEFKFYAGGRGKKMRVRVVDDSADSPGRLDNLIVEAEVDRDKR